ncbi:anti-sigma regulatory factor [Pigmentiphaga aceris]|uniref:Anti-sigma regulatory factor n=1 Tax=Pigmentiphaga aceris TaxID=1940612 RepID=A0A5C0ASC3_9BURK|nr:ATP-binding protein [Pigmentiphaga aceris]QEI05142.1 anti-sigma regulatory factor [Pigmentiphaga aceris]
MTEVVPLRAPEDLVLARKRVREWTTRLAFSTIDQTKVVTAASELARNTLIYGLGGDMHLEELDAQGRKGLRLTFIDQGPGIPDIELALTDGYTTGGGMGLGLSGARRLCNEFELDSRVGEGTRITVTQWKRASSRM